MSFLTVLEGLELTCTLVMTEEQITIQVLKSKIKNLVANHKSQFEIINDINKIMESLKITSTLSENLNSINDFLFLAWNTLSDDLTEKIKLITDMTSSDLSQKVSKYDFTFENGFMLSFGVIMSCYQLHSIQKKFKPATKPEESLKQFRKDLAKQKLIVTQVQLKGNLPIQRSINQVQIQKNLTQPKGQISGASTYQVSGQVSASLSAPKKNSLWNKIKAFGSKVGNGLIQGLRIIGVLAMFYMIYNEDRQIDTLIHELKDMNKEYGDNGKFKQKQIIIINLILSFGQLISNLAYASFGCSQQISNFYLMMSIVHNQANASLIEKSEEYFPSYFQFCQSSNEFFENLCKVKVSENSDYDTLKNALQNYRNILQKFIKQWDPIRKINQLGQIFEQFLTTHTFFIKDLLAIQTKSTDLKVSLRRIFVQRNSLLKKINQESWIKIDQQVVLTVAKKYCQFLYYDIKRISQLNFFWTYETLLTFDRKLLNQIGNIIASFVSLIYSQSKNGNILFGRDLLEYTSSKSYQQILDEGFQTPNAVPVPFSQQKQKKQYIEFFRLHFKNLSKNIENPYDNNLYQILEQLPVTFYKYLKDYFSIRGKGYNKLEFVKGLILKVFNKKSDKTQRILIKWVKQKKQMDIQIIR